MIIVFILIVFVTIQNTSQTKSIPEVKVIIIFRNLISENDDRVLLINVWATWCLPCREEFPELVKLADNYEDKVRVIGISIDDYEILKTQVVPFLNDQNAEFENYILKAADPEDFINLLSKDWSGAVPATFVFDKDGNQKKVLIGKQSYDSFETALMETIE